ncbi:MAG: hypothetical protein RSC93_04250 [Erysipelotrichaceae bacterium]
MKKLLKDKRVIYSLVAGIIVALLATIGYVSNLKQENLLVANVKKESILVSEADTAETRTKAYAGNISITYNGEKISIKKGNITGNQYVSNGVILLFKEENGVTNVSARYGDTSAKASFKINVAALINDANGNTVYNSDSYALGFDASGKQTGTRHLQTHESDLDSNGKTLGIQNESQVQQKEESIDSSTGKVSGRPESNPVKKDIPEVKKEYQGSVDMSNVSVPKEIITNPICDYKQVVIVNANDDKSSLNLYSTNGGTEILGVICTSKDGSTYHCVTREGNAMDITVTINSDGSVSTNFLGTYRI